jgi:hypothetical protein
MRTLKRSLGAAAVAVCLSLLGLSQVFLSAQTQAPKIIDNPERPKFSADNAPQLVFNQEISIPLAGRRYCFDVDDEGNIFLLESMKCRITVFDKDGRVLRQFGRQGQGPGELQNSVYLAVAKDKRVHVADRSGKALQIFDRDGKWLERRPLSSLGMVNSLQFDSAGGVYIQDMRNLFALNDEARIKRGVAGLSRLSKFNRDFEKIADVEIWDNRFLRKAGDEGYNFLLYHDIFYYQVDSGDDLYYGDSSRYEIRQLASDGRLKRIIRRSGSRIPTTEQDLANMIREFPERKDQEQEISKSKPFFVDFHVLDKIGLLVGTYDSEWNDKGLMTCDLFDLDGVYIAKVTVPRYYYLRDQDSVSEQRNRLFKNGLCYSIIYNDKDDTLELVRHRVELKWPRETR